MSDALQDDDVSGVPEWVVTYGDMMSLLLTFFIMLVSMSELKNDSGGERSMLDGITERFGATSGIRAVPGRSLQKTGGLTALTSSGKRSEGGTQDAGRKSDGRAGPNETVQSISHGTVVAMGGPTMLFGRFDAELSDDMKQGLDVIASVLSSKPNRIVIRGHATSEPLPPESRYRDSMDLSFARALSVEQYLLERGISRERLLPSGAGDAEPRVMTRDLRLQGQNRRVDVFLIDSYIAGPQNPKSASSRR